MSYSKLFFGGVLSPVAVSGLFAWGALFTHPAIAADFPDHAVTFVVAYAPGGGTDTVARLLGQELTKYINQPVVIDNRPGAGAVIGASVVQRAAPDGYTLLLADPAFVINSTLMPKIPYDLKKDYVPIAGLTMSPLVLTTHPGVQVDSVAQLVALSRKTSAGLSFSSAGIGSTPHMAGELLKFRTDANFTHIPYKGSGPAMANLAAGQLDFAFSTIPAAKSFIQTKRLRALATTGTERSPEFPDAPTVAETIPGFKVLFWTGLFAPAGTPPDVVRKLSEAVRKALASPELKAALEKTGETPSYLPSEKVGAFVDDELKRWSSLIAEAKIKPE